MNKYGEQDRKTLRLISAKIRSGKDVTAEEMAEYKAAENRYTAACAGQITCTW